MATSLAELHKRQLERQEKRIAFLQERVARGRAASGAIEELQSLLPNYVTGTVRTFRSWGTGLVAGGINGLTSLPEAVALAVAAVGGVGVHLLMDLEPDADEATLAVAAGGGSILTYLFTKQGAQGAPKMA